MFFKYLIFILLLGNFTYQVTLYADLKDFKEDVEEEEEENKKKKDKDKKSSKSSENDEFCAKVATTCFRMAGMVWFEHNASVHYNKYPYYEDDIFIKYNIKTEGVTDVGTEVRDFSNQETAELKNFYFSTALSVHSAFEDGTGLMGNFTGKFFKFFGPEFDTRVLWDGDNEFKYFGIGGNLSLIQTNFLSADFYVQKTIMRGLLDRSGYATGFNFISYPSKPIVLRVKFGWQQYENINFNDMEFSAGIMKDRIEYYGGYKYLGSNSATLQGIYLGIRAYF